MNKFILCLCLLMLSSVVYGQTWYFHDTCYTEKKDGKTYIYCTDNYVANRISRDGEVKKNGKIYWRYYHIGLGLQAYVTTRNNIKEGKSIIYYLSGSEVHVGKFINDKKEGEWKVYKCDGVDLRTIKNYKSYYVESNYYEHDKFKYRKSKKKTKCEKKW
jgi:hypothetical protein